MKPTRERCRESGQSLVETVVMLPVLLFLFLGLYYFSALIRVRMQAIEASRYMTWEMVWNVRDQGGDSRDPKELSAMLEELKNVGLDPFLLNVGRARRSINDYNAAITEPSISLDPPQFVKDIFQLQAGNDFTSALESISGPVSDLFSAGGSLAGFAQDFMANQTNWDPEANEAVYSTFVEYRFHGAGPFRKLPAIKMRESSSILSHPMNIVRTDNDQEYESLVGSTDFDPADIFNSCENQGHIFDLWLFPSGPFANNDIANGLSAVMSGGKCFIAQLTNAFSALDAVIDIGFKLPDGTLKEFPELRNSSAGSD